MRTRLELTRGAAAMARDASLAVTGAAGDVHQAVLGSVARYTPGARLLAAPTALVYRVVRAAAAAAGTTAVGLIAAGEALAGRGRRVSDPALQLWLGALNGAVGDYLERTGNPLALQMMFSHRGRHVAVGEDGRCCGIADARPHLVVLVHGLGLSPLHWRSAAAEFHHERLEADLGCTVLDLHYNTGLHISSNGRALARGLEAVVRGYPLPVERITLVGHSMGGLVSRSACHYARLEGRGWSHRVREVVCLGSPHHGAPLERLGHRLTRALGLTAHSRPFARLGGARSAGVQDLRYGSLLDDDWTGGAAPEPHGHPVHPVPLLPDVRYFFGAAVLGADERSARSRWLGDGLVPLASALGEHPDPARRLEVPPHRRRVFLRMRHLRMLRRPEVYEQLVAWLSPGHA